MIDLLRLLRKFRNDAQDICILLIHRYLSQGLFFHNCALMQYGSVEFFLCTIRGELVACLEFMSGAQCGAYVE